MIRKNNNELLVSGPVTFSTYRSNYDQINDLLEEQDFSLDLSAVSEFDSSMLALIFFLQRNMGNRQLTLKHTPAALTALAKLYGVDDLLVSR